MLHVAEEGVGEGRLKYNLGKISSFQFRISADPEHMSKTHQPGS